MVGGSPTLAEIGAEIELLETVEQFGAEVQQFTDWLSTLSGGDVESWLAADSLQGGRPAGVDKSVQYELGKLKDAAFEFSETLSGFADQFKPLTDAAGTADDVNSVVQAISSLSTMIGRADEAVGAQKASELANVISSIKDVSTLLTGLSLNPVIGVFIGLYATALNDAAIGLEKIDAYAARRNDIINSRGGEVDYEAIEAERAAEAASAEEARQAVTARLNELYARRGEAIARLQAGDYQRALNLCARNHQAELREIIQIAAGEGGVIGNAPPNGETLGELERWVENANGAAFDLMVQAANAPEGSAARQQATDRLNKLTEARSRVVDGLGPLRDCVRDTLERYGTSTGDVAVPAATGDEVASAGAGGGGSGNRRAMFIGGAGIFAMAMVAVVLLLPGGDDTANSGGSGAGGSSDGATGSNGAASGATPSGGSSSGLTAAPLIVNPCDIFTAEEVSAMFGKTLVADGSASDRRAICTFRRPEDAGGIHVEVQRNSNSAGFLEEFRKQRADQVATSIDWPNEAELREGEGTSSFWGYVIADDPLGRNVFIWIAGSTEGNSSAVLDIADRLRAAVLEANGRPPGS